jgi:hypothetical protein
MCVYLGSFWGKESESDKIFGQCSLLGPGTLGQKIYMSDFNNMGVYLG